MQAKLTTHARRHVCPRAISAIMPSFVTFGQPHDANAARKRISAPIQGKIGQNWRVDELPPSPERSACPREIADVLSAIDADVRSGAGQQGGPAGSSRSRMSQTPTEAAHKHDSQRTRARPPEPQPAAIASNVKCRTRRDQCETEPGGDDIARRRRYAVPWQNEGHHRPCLRQATPSETD